MRYEIVRNNCNPYLWVYVYDCDNANGRLVHRHAGFTSRKDAREYGATWGTEVTLNTFKYAPVSDRDCRNGIHFCVPQTLAQ